MPLNQQAKKKAAVLSGINDSDYQGKLDYSPVEVKEENVGNTRDSLGDLVVLPCPAIKVNGKV